MVVFQLSSLSYGEVLGWIPVTSVNDYLIRDYLISLEDAKYWYVLNFFLTSTFSNIVFLFPSPPQWGLD